MTDNVFEDQRVSEVPEADSVDNTYPETASTDTFADDSALGADEAFDAPQGDYVSETPADDMDTSMASPEEEHRDLDGGFQAEVDEHLDRDGDGDRLEKEDVREEGEKFSDKVSDKFHDLKESILGDDDRKL